MMRREDYFMPRSAITVTLRWPSMVAIWFLGVIWLGYGRIE
jgi:hypothetical protein